jgi:phage terminase large subunit GpA-like protein
VKGINLTGGIFNWEGHEWQKEILECDHPQICIKKAAQIGATAIFILKILYNLVAGKYPQGAMVIMPTMDSVISYSKSRFGPLIDDNEKIKKLVSSTDSATLKRVRKSFLHFVGGQLTSSLEKGLKKSSTALKSTPVDVILIDELDEI